MTLLTRLVVLLVALPFVTLVHELGHAAVGLAYSNAPVRVRVGFEPALATARLGRLEFRIGRLWAFHLRGRYGEMTIFAPLPTAPTIALKLAGSTANLALAALVTPFALRAHGRVDDVLWLVSYVSIGLAALALLPGTGSDGREALSAWRNRKRPRSGVFEETRKRWATLFANVPADLKTEARSRRLAYGADVVANLPVKDAALRRDYAQLALAGWCWRHVEHGDPSRLEQALHTAGAAVSRDGMERDQRSAEIALRFLADGGRVADGSPGSTPAEREEFLAQALAVIQAGPWTNPPLTERVFYFGIALHDAEQIVV